ncbi:MAG: hypothetical protein ABW157_06125 [Candidatus Thiodiazotropha sp. LLP2]
MPWFKEAVTERLDWCGRAGTLQGSCGGCLVWLGQHPTGQMWRLFGAAGPAPYGADMAVVWCGWAGTLQGRCGGCLVRLGRHPTGQIWWLIGAAGPAPYGADMVVNWCGWASPYTKMVPWPCQRENHTL